MLAAAGLLLAMQASGDVQFEHPTHDEVHTRLVACGFEKVTILYEEEIFSDVVIVADKDATDDEILCAAKALSRTAYVPEFERSISRRYNEFSNELARPLAQALAIEFFSERPEMGDPPSRNPDESDIELAKRIEAFCGPSTEGAFTDEFGGVVISPEWFRKVIKIGGPADDFFEAVGCLINAATLTDLPIGFVGNEREAVAELADVPTTE